MKRNTSPSIHSITIKTIDGHQLDLSAYRGNILLIVNTASHCGFTPQYEGLERLYRLYKDRGLLIIGCPCDQFGHQEPGDSEEIQDFCKTRYAVSFPITEKIDVNGKNAHPLFRYLCTTKPGVFGTQRIKWNFTKFLLDRNGEVIKRYSPTTRPDALQADIEALL